MGFCFSSVRFIAWGSQKGKGRLGLLISLLVLRKLQKKSGPGESRQRFEICSINRSTYVLFTNSIEFVTLCLLKRLIKLLWYSNAALGQWPEKPRWLFFSISFQVTFFRKSLDTIDVFLRISNFKFSIHCDGPVWPLGFVRGQGKSARSKRSGTIDALNIERLSHFVQIFFAFTAEYYSIPHYIGIRRSNFSNKYQDIFPKSPVRGRRYGYPRAR